MRVISVQDSREALDLQLSSPAMVMTASGAKAKNQSIEGPSMPVFCQSLVYLAQSRIWSANRHGKTGTTQDLT
jgi:hypothetical protein